MIWKTKLPFFFQFWRNYWVRSPEKMLLKVLWPPHKGTRASNSKMLEVKQERQKASSAEQKFFLELRQKRKVYALREQRQGMWEKHRDATCRCREKICVAKVQLEMKLSRNKLGVGGKGFLTYILGKGQMLDSVIPMGHFQLRIFCDSANLWKYRNNFWYYGRKSLFWFPFFLYLHKPQLNWNIKLVAPGVH